MNYQKVYDSLIAKRIVEPTVGYFEKHHIIPKALGGTNDKSNLVNLTGREHFIAHVLLAKIHGGKMWMAVLHMKHRRGKDPYINSRAYETARKEWANWSSKNQRGENHWAYGKPSWNKGKKMVATSGSNHWNYGNKMPDHVRQALLTKNTGSKRTEETRKKMGEWQKGQNNNRYGKKLSDEQIQALKHGGLNWYKNSTPEQRKQRAANRVGQKRSKETCARISEALKKSWADKRKAKEVLMEKSA